MNKATYRQRSLLGAYISEHESMTIIKENMVAGRYDAGAVAEYLIHKHEAKRRGDMK